MFDIIHMHDRWHTAPPDAHHAERGPVHNAGCSALKQGRLCGLLRESCNDFGHHWIPGKASPDLDLVSPSVPQWPFVSRFTRIA